MPRELIMSRLQYLWHSCCLVNLRQSQRPMLTTSPSQCRHIAWSRAAGSERLRQGVGWRAEPSLLPAGPDSAAATGEASGLLLPSVLGSPRSP